MTDHAAAADHAEAHEHAHPHIVPVRTYILVFLALMVGTAITVGASYVDFGHSYLNNLVALLIAFTKATLVVLFFMHVKYSSKVTQLAVGSGFAFLVILFFFTFADYLTRGWLGTPGS
ncbi:MAG: cytochrome C oxidase subunit IV family protein [Vicinamibacteria bacterium]|jgi:cytochrome c oxidase subunit 4|nr:cytochrome C oxidase subunit IV family protein [Vicinamibacteria bacterium]